MSYYGLTGFSFGSEARRQPYNTPMISQTDALVKIDWMMTKRTTLLYTLGGWFFQTDGYQGHDGEKSLVRERTIVSDEFYLVGDTDIVHNVQRVMIP